MYYALNKLPSNNYLKVKLEKPYLNQQTKQNKINIQINQYKKYLKIY